QDYILTPDPTNFGSGSFATIVNNTTVYLSSGDVNGADGKTSVARFDGAYWRKLENLDANSYKNFSFGDDFFLRKTDNGDIVSRTYNPNNFSWSADQIISTT